ncbi:MAG: electron transport complex subunit RsxD [Methylococcaceae bacterium]|nr:electron transport complex subunit RsxD [Methylococcaceae bacterium]
MRFSTAPAPHIQPQASVRGLMLGVLAALVPGVAAQVWQFGAGVLIQCLLALIAALACEASMLWGRGRPLVPSLLDGSAALTAVLLAVSLPPVAPWWITVFGALFAITVGKHLYGGLGYNPFNPAMLGYAVLLISFPRTMTAWLPPTGVAAAQPGWAELLDWIFRLTPPIDGMTMATPLDTLKTQLGMGVALDQIRSSPLFGGLAGAGWQWVNLGYLLGGSWLLWRGAIAWQIPAAFLGTLFLAALIFFLAEPASFPTPLFHLFGGATMLGAFFIATDPVTASTTPRGRLIYGSLIGLLVFVIRSWGGYPDGVAFAVLLMNLAAPTLDHFTRPRPFGRQRR